MSFETIEKYKFWMNFYDCFHKQADYELKKKIKNI